VPQPVVRNAAQLNELLSAAVRQENRSHNLFSAHREFRFL